MKNNKGFTLIELLAVIVILAIIALIATPTILGVVEDARKGAAESSVLGYVDAIEKQAMINAMDTSKTQINADMTIAQLKTAGVTVKGSTPEQAGSSSTTSADGLVGITSDGEVKTTYFKVGKYTVKYDASTGKANVQG